MFRYDAFICYSSNDMNRVREIHEILEKDFKRIDPKIRGARKKIIIARDETDADVNPNLRKEILGKVASSRKLIVFCSPNVYSKQEWVNLEIEHFRNTHFNGISGREINEDIIPVLLDSPLNSSPVGTAFPHKLIEGLQEVPRAIELREGVANRKGESYQNFLKSTGIFRIYAGLLDIEFISLYDRQVIWEKKKRRSKIILISILTLLFSLLGIIGLDQYRKTKIENLSKTFSQAEKEVSEKNFNVAKLLYSKMIKDQKDLMYFQIPFDSNKYFKALYSIPYFQFHYDSTLNSGSDITCVRYHHHDKLFLYGKSDATIQLFSYVNRVTRSLQLKRIASIIRISPNGNVAAIGTYFGTETFKDNGVQWDNAIEIVDLKSFRVVKSIPLINYIQPKLDEILFLDEDHLLVSINGRSLLIDIENVTQKRIELPFTEAISLDNRSLLITKEQINGQLQVVDKVSMKVEYELDKNEEPPIGLTRLPHASLDYNPQKELIYYGDTKGDITVFKKNGDQVLKIRAGEFSITEIHYLPKSNILISGSEDGWLKFWEPETLDLLFKTKIPDRLMKFEIDVDETCLISLHSIQNSPTILTSKVWKLGLNKANNIGFITSHVILDESQQIVKAIVVDRSAAKLVNLSFPDLSITKSTEIPLNQVRLLANYDYDELNEGNISSIGEQAGANNLFYYDFKTKNSIQVEPPEGDHQIVKLFDSKMNKVQDWRIDLISNMPIVHTFITADGKYFYIGTMAGDFRLYDMTSAKEPMLRGGGISGITGKFQFAQGNKILLTSELDRFFVWDILKKKCIDSLVIGNYIERITYSRKSNLIGILVSSNTHKYVKICSWTIDNKLAILAEYSLGNQMITDLRFSTFGNFIIVSTIARGIQFINNGPLLSLSQLEFEAYQDSSSKTK